MVLLRPLIGDSSRVRNRRYSLSAVLVVLFAWSSFVLSSWHVPFATASDWSSLPVRLFKSWMPFQSESSSWSSLLTVDPTKILSTMVKRGGLLIPAYIEKELQVLSKVCRVDQARLNVVDRQLELVNLTVSLPGAAQGNEKDMNHALRLGRVRVQWDSYLRPCVEVEVEQVDILVEFTNMLLTRNNWDELYDAGFPPRMIIESDDDISSDSSGSSSTFVRIGSIDFKGNMVVRIQSRPLDHKPLGPDFVLDFKSLRELSKEIKEVSKTNQSNGDKRPGCTTDQLYDLTKFWFQGKLQRILQHVVYDMATNKDVDGTILRKHTQRITSSARDIVADYAQGAGNKLQGRIEQRLNRWDGLIPQKHLNLVGALSRAKIDQITDGSTIQEIAKSEWFRKACKSPIRVLVPDEPVGVDKETYEFPDTVVFPDW